VLRAVLHHMLDVDAALREFARVLHPGGRLAIIDGVAFAPEIARQLNAELLAAGLPTETHYGFDVASLTERVVSSGFGEVSTRLDGVSTFGTPPFVSREFTTDRFVLTASRG